jgi:hypothetical protein
MQARSVSPRSGPWLIKDMTMKILKPLATTIAAVTLISASHALAQASDTTSLLAAEDALFKAEVAHDATTVAAALADDLTYVHGSGKVQTKADFVSGIASGNPAYVSITADNRTARVWGDIGVVRGRTEKVIGDMHLSDLYLAVYVQKDGHWQLLDWQTSPLQPPHKPN